MIYRNSNERGLIIVDSMDYELNMSKKLLPPSCLFCLNSSPNVEKFEISKDYGGGNTIRYDLTNFLGYQIEYYLKEDDFLCQNCMNFFKNMAIMKTKLVKFLQDRDESVDKKIIAFNDFWKMFTKFAMKLVKFNPNDTDETWNFEGITRSQTPNPLVLKYSEPCDDKQNNGCNCNASLKESSEADREIRKFFRIKRGNNWTRPKGQKKSRALSRSYPDNANMSSDCEKCGYSADNRSASSSRPPSSFNCSTISRPPSSIDYSEVSRPTSSIDLSTSRLSRPRSKRRRVEGRPLKTRSVSRSEVLLANVMLARESNKLYCSDLNCDLFFANVDNLAAHKVQDHGIIPRFSCSQCWKAYTTRKELEMHNKVHDAYIVHCFQCGTEIKGSENLQQHLKEHQEYSIDCRYCNFSFLSKQELKLHCSSQHIEKERKIFNRRKSRVLKATVYQKEVEVTSVNNNNIIENDFEPRILLNRTPPPEKAVDNSTNILRTIVPCSQVSSAITISDTSPCEIPDISPITISDISSVIVFKEVSTGNMNLTPANGRITSVPQNVSSDNSPEVQIVSQDETINQKTLSPQITNILCDDINRESICNTQRDHITD